MGTDNLQVTLNGKDVPARVLSLNGRPEEPGAGDLLLVHGLPPIVLQDAETMRLREPGYETGLLLSQAGGGDEEHVMACRVGHAWVGGVDGLFPFGGDAGVGAGGGGKGEMVFVNPLGRLSAAECSRLRGVRLEAWEPGLETQLAGIDPGRCAISLESAVLRACGGGLPPLPRDLRYLTLEHGSGSWGRVFDVASLSQYPALRVLVFSHIPVDLDIGDIVNARQLRVLHAPGNRVRGLPRLAEFSELRDLELRRLDGGGDDSLRALGSLPALRRLRLAHCDELTSVEFALSLQALECLDVSGSAVTDLAPLADLPMLREVQALGAPVRALPERQFPNLRLLNVVNTPLDAEAVEAFRRLHPDARVFHRWAEALRGTVAGADRVRVRSGGTSRRNPAWEETLVEESDAAAIEILARGFAIDDGHSGGRCRCVGSPTIEFRRGGVVLAEIGLHHGMSARWSGWPGDALLTRRSRRWVAAWLSERGEHSFVEDDE